MYTKDTTTLDQSADGAACLAFIRSRLGRMHPSSTPSPVCVMVTGIRGNRPEYGIVGVPLLGTAIEGVPVDRHQRRVEEQPCHQVRIGNERLAEGDEIGAAVGDRLVGALLVEAVIGDDYATEQTLELLVVERRHPCAGSITLDGVEIGYALSG